MNESPEFPILLTLATGGAGLSAILAQYAGGKLTLIILTKGALPWYTKATRGLGKVLKTPCVGTALDILNPFFKSGGKIDYINLYK